MKKILILLAVCLICSGCICLTACTNDEQTEQIPSEPTEGIIYELEGDTYTVMGFDDGESNYSTDPAISIGMLVIAKEYNGKPVTTINGSAFSDNARFSSVFIPNSIIYIRYRAFASCLLTKVIFEENSALETIGQDAFSNCWNLNEFAIPDSVIDIHRYAFDNCSLLYETSDNSTYVGDWLIWGNTTENVLTLKNTTVGLASYSLSFNSYATEITIPRSVRAISREALRQWNMLRALTFEENSQLTHIGEGAFSYCPYLKTISLPEKVVSIGNTFVNHCNALESITVAENNAAYMDIDGVLYDKDATQLIRCPAARDAELIMPDTVTLISNCALYGCANITDVQISDSLIEIGDYAFDDCDNLTSLVFPDTLTTIGFQCFGYIYTPIFYSTPRLDSYNDISGFGPAYWAGEWHYDIDGKPVPN